MSTFRLSGYHTCHSVEKEWLWKELAIYVRAGCYRARANLQPQQCEEAAARLKQGLQQLVGMETVVGV
jgi:hypothetical protein